MPVLEAQGTAYFGDGLESRSRPMRWRWHMVGLAAGIRAAQAAAAALGEERDRLTDLFQCGD